MSFKYRIVSKTYDGFHDGNYWHSQTRYYLQYLMSKRFGKKKWEYVLYSEEYSDIKKAQEWINRRMADIKVES